MKDKRIIFILGSMNRGGAERVMSIISNDYAAKGWKVDIIQLLYNKVAYELNPQINVLDFSGKTISRAKRSLYWIKNIRNYVKNTKPEIVVSFAARINILTQIACIGLNTKVFVSERNDPHCDGRSKLIDLATCILYPKANAVVFQTRRAMSYFPKLKNGIIITNPIVVEQSVIDIPQKKIVAVGRLTKQKNQGLLFHAFAKISNEFPEYTLELYGDGELKIDLHRLSQKLEIEDKVFFHGNVPNVHECIADASLFVLSSDYEGLSNALLEAMMMGLPCVATNCAGSDEYIINGKNGILVPVGDENALAFAIKTMLLDEQMRIQCGMQARKDSKMFTKDAVLEKWHQLMD